MSVRRSLTRAISSDCNEAMMARLAVLITKLAKIQWKWDRSGMESAAVELGLARTRQTANRENYTMDDYRLSIFSEADQVLWLDVYLKQFDIGEVYLNECASYPAVLKQRDAEYRLDFRRTATEIGSILGPPTFQGTPADPGYVFDEVVPEALLLASWTLKDASLILKYEHQDKELPLTLDLRVWPG